MSIEYLTDLLRPYARDAAQRGAAFLDQHGPSGWADQIDLPTLDLANCSRCVLGQLYGYYITGVDDLEGSLRDDGGEDPYGILDPSTHGFCAPTADSSDTEYVDVAYSIQCRRDENNEVYRVLTEEWTTIIRSRQEAANRES